MSEASPDVVEMEIEGQPEIIDDSASDASTPTKGRRGKKRGKGRKGDAKPKRKRRGPSISTIIALAILIVGAGIIAYPTFSDWWNSYHQSRAIASYVQAVQETDPAKIEAMLNEAHEYNERLATMPNRFNMSDAEKEEYKRLLDLTGNGVMGYVQINSIDVDYPIYHGMDESVLQIAIGHLEGSSFPVGGETTHAVISGHRGLPSARLFTDIDKLTEGDTFTVTVLNQTVTYEVDQIRIVLPTDLSNLNIYQGEDYCTLITCTPYGINTHRLLVRGHRIDNIIDSDVITAEALQIPRYIAIPAVGIPILFLFLIGALIYSRTTRTPNRELITEALRERVRQENAANAGATGGASDVMGANDVNGTSGKGATPHSGGGGPDVR